MHIGVECHLKLIVILVLIVTGRRSVRDVKDTTLQQLPGCMPPAPHLLPLASLHIGKCMSVLSDHSRQDHNLLSGPVREDNCTAPHAVRSILCSTPAPYNTRSKKATQQGAIEEQAGKSSNSHAAAMSTAVLATVGGPRGSLFAPSRWRAPPSRGHTAAGCRHPGPTPQSPPRSPSLPAV